MIPVEHFAARTARIAALAAKLRELDHMWTTLDAQAAQVAGKVSQQHEAGLSAGEALSQLERLDTVLAWWERDAIETMASALSLLREVGDG